MCTKKIEICTKGGSGNPRAGGNGTGAERQEVQ